ncbi:MAG: VapC toxin family PIN domain ribonuclease [Proteobacteria bacterium]|nr:MAG: VapC toxin family PIN domain ribonuclease [Pseudomonadota bacterium]
MIFDTDVLIWLFRGDPAAAQMVQTQPEREMSIISLMELLQGARSREESRQVRSFLVENEFAVIPVDEPISYRAAALIEEHASSGGLQVADALIAATTLERGATLATANARHFRAVPKLRLKIFRP